MKEGTEKPDWIPDNLTITELKDRQVSLTQRNEQVIAFGSIPQGWTIILDGSRRAKLDIDARFISKDVSILIKNAHNIDISKRVYGARVDGSNQHQTKLNIGRKKFHLEVGAGRYLVSPKEEGVDYSLTVKPNDDDLEAKRKTTIDGNARIASIKGRGSIEIGGVPTKGVRISNVVGSIILREALVAANVNAKNLELTVSKDVNHCKINAHILRCNGRLLSSGVSAYLIDVRSTIQGLLNSKWVKHTHAD
ncbi:hypothetical protein [Wenzhouxiangella sp. EGI_FJ10409]|uniref:hypothetical protein n=1 Tax=Wenzhouxiangella sp. EGI_FJ10409 TaxID=3243767 RepID=UPI0035DBE015